MIDGEARHDGTSTRKSFLSWTLNQIFKVMYCLDIQEALVLYLVVKDCNVCSIKALLT